MSNDYAGDARTESARPNLVPQVMDLFEQAFRMVTTDDGELWVVPKRGPRIAQPFTTKAVIGALASSSRSGPWLTAAKQAAEFLEAAPPPGPKVRLNLRFADFPGGVVIDLGQEGNSKCVVVTADGWSVREEPPEQVLFRRPRHQLPLPEPVIGRGLDDLAALMAFDPRSAEFSLIRGWLACAPFASSPRPVIFFTGAQGSGKSTRARLLVDLWDPKPAEGIGGSFGQKLGDDQTKMLNQAVFAYDNLDRVSSASSDLLCTAVTGANTENKKLYTDKESVQISYKRTGVLTGLDIPRGFKADALDRIIRVECPPIDRRVAEADILQEFYKARAELLAALYEDIVTILQGLPAVKTDQSFQPERMVDYSQRLHALGPVFSRALAEHNKELKLERANSEPVTVATAAWLGNVIGPDGSWEGSTADAFAAASTAHRADAAMKGAPFPKHAVWYARELRNNEALLRAHGYAMAKADTRTMRRLRFKRLTFE